MAAHAYTLDEIRALFAEAEQAPQPEPVYAGMVMPVEWHTLTGGPLADHYRYGDV